MCEQNSELYNRFKINLGSHELLDPVKDLCACLGVSLQFFLDTLKCVFFCVSINIRLKGC